MKLVIQLVEGGLRYIVTIEIQEHEIDCPLDMLWQRTLKPAFAVLLSQRSQQVD